MPKHLAAFGDLTFEVGFVLAAVLYALFFRLQGEGRVEEAWISRARQPSPLPATQGTERAALAWSDRPAPLVPIPAGT